MTATTNPPAPPTSDRAATARPRPPAVAPGTAELDELLAAIGEHASERDAGRIHPFDQIDQIRRARLGALRLSPDIGGGGASLRELFDVALLLGRADPNVAHILRNHFAFVEARLLRQQAAGPGAPLDPWLAKVADGLIFGLAATELSRDKVGPRDFDFQTTLTPDGDGFRLAGTKYYSTGSYYADLVPVRAVTIDGAAAVAIVPADRPGVDLVDDWDGIGQRLTGTGTTVLRDVRVEADEVIVDRPGGDGQGTFVATFPQLYLTTVIAGILRNVLDDAVDLVRARPRTFYHAPADRPADDPIIQQTVGEISAQAFAAEALALSAADALDASTRHAVGGVRDPALALEASLRAAKAKIVVDELATRTATLLFDVAGASASKRSNNLDRHWRNIRTLASHNPRQLKARSIGDHILNATPLPDGAFF